MLGKRIL